MSSADRSIRVVRVGPLATVQDRGRPNLARQGVPHGGPLDRAAFEATLAALARVGATATNALELPLIGARFVATGARFASIDGELTSLTDGDEIVVERTRRAVRYLAVDGGFDVAEVLGGEGTWVVGATGFGGFEGRAVRVGDRLPLRTTPSSGLASPPTDGHFDRSLPIVDRLEAIACADADDATLAAIQNTVFHVDPRSDRTGTRLVGEPPLPATTARLPSRPLVRGAVQVPPDGQPIVIGPDGPTTGGYLVAAVLTEASQDALARLRSTDRFTLQIRAAVRKVGPADRFHA